jgi:hypothetical protein
LQEVQTAQGQQLQLHGEQQNSSAGSYVVRDDTTVMQQVRPAGTGLVRSSSSSCLCIGCL